MILSGKKGKQEERCLKRARKNWIFYQKWGKIAGGFYAIISLATIGMGIFLCWFTSHIVKVLAGLAGNAPANNQMPNLADQGFALGLAFGFMAGFFIFKGAMYLLHAIQYFRGDPNDHLLILYHDLVLELSKDKGELPNSEEKSEDEI